MENDNHHRDGVYLLSDVMICFSIFVSLCQAALNFLDIFGWWQLLRINTPADEHITDSCVVVDMFLLNGGLSVEVFRLNIDGGHLV